MPSHKKRKLNPTTGDPSSKPSISASKPSSEPHAGRQPRGQTKDRSGPENNGEALQNAKLPSNPTGSVSLPITSNSPPMKSILTTTTAVPRIPTSLHSTHAVLHLSVLSSTQIKKRVTSILSHLLPSSDLSTTTLTKPPIVVLSAKAPVASKATSIVEIAKREMADVAAVWFQYLSLDAMVLELPRRGLNKETARSVRTGKRATGGKAEVQPGPHVDADADDARPRLAKKATIERVEEALPVGEEDDPEPFETMPDPPKPPLPAEPPKLRKIPRLTIYLSTKRVESLRKAHG
ncbi:MAG: hypothetical protein M1817_006053 [Caeruleum heppii]|nr:MAG: hypothetical protein M1817_006053 [Caeruleum heppii]